VITKTADFQLFWTSFDPLDLASGSIDVLGFQGAYMALANKLLPGFTTVTTSPRYVSMLCAAVAAAETAYPGTGDTTIRIRQARMGAVKSYERAWALACGLAARNSAIGDKAVNGLRGIRYVFRRLDELSSRERSIRTSSFNLLANQVRYGGIGAYSALMEDGHLASMRSVTLRPLGAKLAESFPVPGEGLVVWDEERPLSLDGLCEWGDDCHLGDFTRDEGRCLATALRGGEEGGWEDDIRWTTLRLLATCGKENDSEPVLLERLLTTIRDGGGERLRAPLGCLRQIETALVLIDPYERLYQGIQFLFDTVRAAATDEPVAGLDALARTTPCDSAFHAAQSAASDLLASIETAESIHPETARDIRGALVEARMLSFAEAVCRATDALQLLNVALGRHLDVQHGKIDRSERKAAWIHHDPSNGTVRLTAQRHQLPRSGRCGSWEKIPRHPYRTVGARCFVNACRIR
jgi:hypothetical protein